MSEKTPNELDQASAEFDDAHAQQEVLAQHAAVLDALEDFVVALAPAAIELGLSLAPGGSVLETALKVAARALPVVVERLQKSSPPPPPPLPPPSRPGL
jgi:hypothetical protein